MFDECYSQDTIEASARGTNLVSYFEQPLDEVTTFLYCRRKPGIFRGFFLFLFSLARREMAAPSNGGRLFKVGLHCSGLYT